MATLTTIVCFFAIQAIFLMDNAAADPNIDINPTEIRLGISSLDIKCTISLKNYPDVADLVSLNLLRANASGQNFQTLAVVTEFSPHFISLVTQEQVSATGLLSQTGESFINLAWDYPTARQAGVYQCVARGLDMLGNNVALTNSSVLTSVEPNLNDLFEKLQQVEMNEKSMQNTIASLENTVTQLRTIVNQLEPLGTYQDRDYFVSREKFQHINESTQVCELCGGTLIEIDDESEYNAIVGFLKNVDSDITHVILSGTDEVSEGNWTLPLTSNPLPFTDWHSSQPSCSRVCNCMGLYSGFSWQMYDSMCDFELPQHDVRFTCEIPSMGKTDQI